MTFSSSIGPHVAVASRGQASTGLRALDTKHPVGALGTKIPADTCHPDPKSSRPVHRRSIAKRPAGAAPRISRSTRNARKVRQGFDLLRSFIPTYPSGKNLTKIETLRLAVIYIQDLAALAENSSITSEITPEDVVLASAASTSFATTPSTATSADTTSVRPSWRDEAESRSFDELSCSSPPSSASSLSSSISLSLMDANPEGRISTREHSIEVRKEKMTATTKRKG